MCPASSELTDWPESDWCLPPITNILSIPPSAQFVSLVSGDHSRHPSYSFPDALFIKFVHRNTRPESCFDLGSYATRDVSIQPRKRQSLTGLDQIPAVVHLPFSLLWGILVSARIDDLKFGEVILDRVAL